MDNSILRSTKINIGVLPDYTPFDLNISTLINSVFSDLFQLGITPTGFMIEDDATEWTDLDISDDQKNRVKTYVFLKVRLLFDPPATSFAIEAINKELEKQEFRLLVAHEGELAND